MIEETASAVDGELSSCVAVVSGVGVATWRVSGDSASFRGFRRWRSTTIPVVGWGQVGRLEPTPPVLPLSSEATPIGRWFGVPRWRPLEARQRGVGFRPPSALSADFAVSSLAILGGVELLHDAGLAAGGVPSVEGALLGGLVEGNDGFLDGALGGVEVVGLNGASSLCHEVLRLRPKRSIALPLSFSNTGRFCTGQNVTSWAE